MSDPETHYGQQDSHFKEVFDATMRKCLVEPPADLAAGFVEMCKQLLKIATGLLVTGGKGTDASLTTPLWARTAPWRAHPIRTPVEGAAIVTGFAAAGYLGICIGALIVATYDTYGWRATGMLHGFAHDFERQTKVTLQELLSAVMKRSPQLSCSVMWQAYGRASMLSTPPNRKRYGATGGR